MGLIEEHSATRAGKRLGLTHQLPDTCLMRYSWSACQDGIRPAPGACKIAPRLREGLLQLQLALGPAEFLPEHTGRDASRSPAASTHRTMLVHTLLRVSRHWRPKPNSGAGRAIRA